MNTIIMTVYVAGTIMGQSTFGSMDKCFEQAKSEMIATVMGLAVVCSYKDSKTKIEPPFPSGSIILESDQKEMT